MKKFLAIMIASVMVLSLAVSVSARYSLDRLFINENDRIVGEAAGQPVSGPTGEPVRINPGDKLYILGWAVNEYDPVGLDKIVYTIDGGDDIECTGGYRDRPDVAAAFGLDPIVGEGAGFGFDEAKDGGMMELTGIDQLSEGRYEIEIKAIYDDGSEEIFDSNPYGIGVFTLLVGDVIYDDGGDDPIELEEETATVGMLNIDRIYVNENVLDYGNNVQYDDPIQINRGDRLYILGWAYAASNLREIVYSIDGGENVSCPDNYRDRYDVMGVLGERTELGEHAGFGHDDAASGGMLELSGIEELEDGEYILSIKAVYNDNTCHIRNFNLKVGEGGGSIIQPTGDGQWHWISGEEFEYTHWASGEPNGGNDEPRMAIWPDYWNDLCIDSYEQGGYICEWNDEESGSYAYNGHSYRIYRGHYSWDNAEAKCEQLGGYLACITSAEEQAFIESINRLNDGLWIGGYYGGGDYTGETGGDEDPDERQEVTGWLCGDEPSSISPCLWFNPVGEPDDRYVEIEFTSAVYFSGIHGFYYCSNVDAGFAQATMLIELRRYGDLVAVEELSCNGDTWYDVDFEEVFEPGDYTLKFSCLSGSGIDNDCWFVIGCCKGYKCADVYANTVSSAAYDDYPAIMLIEAEPAVTEGRISIDAISVNNNELSYGNDVKYDDPIQMDKGDKLYIIGWAYGSDNLKEIVYSINGGEDISCPDNYRDRSDVAAAFGLDAHLGEHAGFGYDNDMLELSGMDQLEEGTYRLTIKAVFNDGTSIKKHYNVKIGEDQPYYPPVGDESGRINIDRIHVNANELDSSIDVKDDHPIRITEGDRMYILGWALGDNEYLREIVYKIDFGADISCSDNYRDRTDVAGALGVNPYLGIHAGFGHDDAASGGMFELSGINNLKKGSYVLTIKAIFNDDTYCTINYDIVVEAGGSQGTDPGTDPGTNPGTDPGTEDEELYDHELSEVTPGKLNIIIDGGTSNIEANPGDEIQVKIVLKNNPGISSLKAVLKYDKKLSVVTDSKGKAKVTFDIYDPDDYSAMKSTVLNAENRKLIVNWLSGNDEVKGDITYATITFKVAEDVEPGRFLPITAEIIPSDVFDSNQNNVEFNLINGGIDIIEHKAGEIEFDEHNHWHKCTVCGEILDIEAHKDDDNDGVCDVCGYVIKIKGDINGDKEINNKDVVMLFRCVSYNETVEDIFVYDFNSDGEINNKDVVALFRYVSTVQ